MRCEIVAVGTELLLGQIVDTNSSWLGEQLALAGIARRAGARGRGNRVWWAGSYPGRHHA